MEFENWLKSIAAGLVLMLAVFAVLVGFNYIGPYIAPIVEEITGLSEPSFVGLLVLVFLVGFAATYRSANETDDFFTSPGGSHKPGLPVTREPVASLVHHNTVEEIDLVETAFVNHLRERTEKLNENAEVVLKIQLKKEKDNHLSRDTLLYYITHLEKKFENFKYVVFVDRFNKFVFYTKAKEFRKKIEPTDGSHIMDLINANRYEVLREESYIYHQSIPFRMNAMRALRLMAQKEWQDVMVISQGWAPRYLGVLELKDLLHRVLVESRSSSKRNSMLNSIPLIGSEEKKDKPSQKDK